MLIKLRVEPATLPRVHRSDPQPLQPTVTHHPRLPPAHWVTPVETQTPRSKHRTPDYEMALDMILTGTDPGALLDEMANWQRPATDKWLDRTDR